MKYVNFYNIIVIWLLYTMIVLRSVILAKNVVMFEAHFLASYFEVKDFFCLNLSIGQRTLTSFLTAALSVLKK